MEYVNSGLIRAVVPMKISESPKNLNFVLFSSEIGDQTFTYIVGLLGSSQILKHPKILYLYYTFITFFTHNSKIITDRVPQCLKIRKQRPQKHNSGSFLGLLQEQP